MYLVDAIVAVAILRRVLAVLASLAAAHHPHRLASPPVLGLRARLVIHGRVTVQCQRPVSQTTLSVNTPSDVHITLATPKKPTSTISPNC